MTPYDDDWPTCVKTNATLRMFSDQVGPEAISKKLNINPTESFSKGESHGNRGLIRKLNGWLLNTEEAVDSKDTRRHIDWLLSKLSPRKIELDELRSNGVEVDISCLWMSTGQGGPLMSPQQMAVLCQLDLEIWWDIYFDDEEQA